MIDIKKCLHHTFTSITVGNETDEEVVSGQGSLAFDTNIRYPRTYKLR